MGVCGFFIAFFNIFMCAVSFVIYAGDRYDQIFIEGLESSEYNTLYMIKKTVGERDYCFVLGRTGHSSFTSL